MHKLTTLALSTVAFSFIITTACKKSSSASSSSSNIVGSWRVTKQYQDNNKNGIMDADEQDSTILIENPVIKYNSDGSGAEMVIGISAPFTWKLINSNAYLQVTDTTQSPVDKYFKIVSLTATSMELIDTTEQTNSGISWTYFAKQ